MLIFAYSGAKNGVDDGAAPSPESSPRFDPRVHVETDLDLLQVQHAVLGAELQAARYQIGSLELQLQESLQRAEFFEHALGELAAKLSLFRSRAQNELMGFLVSASIAQEGPLLRG